MARPGRLGVGIIGAGKVGAVLGAALRAAEHAVVGVSAVSEASRERAETLLPGVPVLEIQDIVERAELVVLAVPDDALGELVEGLAKLGPGNRANWWRTPPAGTASGSSSQCALQVRFRWHCIRP